MSLITAEQASRIERYIRRCIAFDRPIRLPPCVAIPFVVKITIEDFYDRMAAEAMVNEGGPAVADE